MGFERWEPKNDGSETAEAVQLAEAIATQQSYPEEEDNTTVAEAEAAAAAASAARSPPRRARSSRATR